MRYAIKESMFVSYSRDEYFFFMKADEYIIKTDNDGAFSLPVDTVESEEILEKIIKNRMSVVVSYNVPSNPNAKVYYIAEITDADGTVIVDCEAISAARTENSREGLTMLWVICLVYWGLRRLLDFMPRPRAPASGGVADTAGIPQFLRKGCAHKRAKQMSRTAERNK